MKAVLTMACTVPVLTVLKVSFSSFRKPYDKVLEEARKRKWETHLRCGRKRKTHVHEAKAEAKAANQPTNAPAMVTRAAEFATSSAEVCAETEMKTFQRKSRLWAAAIHCFVLVVGVACTVMIALVVVTFDGETTKSWLLATFLSVTSDLLLEPFKPLAIVFGLTLLQTKLCVTKKKRRRTLRDAIGSARIAVAMTNDAAPIVMNRSRRQRKNEAEWLEIWLGFNAPVDALVQQPSQILVSSHLPMRIANQSAAWGTSIMSLSESQTGEAQQQTSKDQMAVANYGNKMLCILPRDTDMLWIAECALHAPIPGKWTSSTNGTIGFNVN
eukprot:SAG31_NODE_2458_length_5661_cov_2.020137_1_plen_327_part_00